MKRVLSLLLAIVMILVPFAIHAEEFDVYVEAKPETLTVEVGDQFLVSIEKSVADLKFLTFRVNGTFDCEMAEVIAPVYTNENLGILTNNFDNEEGTFTFEGYDQTIRGTDEDVICSILFKAKKNGEFNVNLDGCMLGKVGENAFYNLGELGTLSGVTSVTITEDTDEETVSIIEDAKPLSPYDDMLGYDWAEKAVGVMSELGVLENIADTSFEPDKYITRGEFITMLMKVCKMKKSIDGVEPFSDVKEDSYQYEYIMTAKKMGIIEGDGEGKFMPHNRIKREDICVLVFRTMLKMRKARSEINADEYLSKFTSDGCFVSDYAKESVAGLIRAKLIIGDNYGRLNPEYSMTRAEACVLLNRLAEYNILIGGF